MRRGFDQANATILSEGIKHPVGVSNRAFSHPGYISYHVTGLQVEINSVVPTVLVASAINVTIKFDHTAVIAVERTVGPFLAEDTVVRRYLEHFISFSPVPSGDVDQPV